MRVRTGYSFRNAVGFLPEVMEVINENLWPAAPITDTASTFGFVKWNKLCEENSIKPIFGIELAVTDSINAKKPVVDHWTFLAKDDVQSIHQLLHIATGQFRYQPLLTYSQALDAQGVIKIIGHKSLIDELEPMKDLYLGLGPGCTRGYVNAVLDKYIEPIAVSNNKYTRENDKGMYEVICGRDASTQSYPQHILSDDEWVNFVSGLTDIDQIEKARTNWDLAMTKCNAQLKTAELLKPDIVYDLRQMCIQGNEELPVRLNLEDPVYKERLDRELALIAEKNYEDYFYIIADICQWARQRMIVGPARGSSCGSLVCYLLGITMVDPIPYDLIFERFIDVNRDDLPDIDIDFSDQKRSMVFDYMAEKYGADHIARLGTVAMYKPRSAINEAAAALDVPPWKTNPVLDSIIERSGGDSRALQAVEDTFNETTAGQELKKEFPEMSIAFRMEGHPRHYSQHAAGIVLTQEPIDNYVAVDVRKGSTHCDKKDAEDLGLLKIDALGLTQLSIFEDALELAGLSHDHLDHVPLNDTKAFRVLNEGRYSGVFQFNGLALQSVTRQVEIKHIEDIISITALARPGPLNTGGTHHWIKVKTGVEPLTYPHPLFEPFLKNTLGVVAYQEQVMQIGREIGGLSWGDVTALRKAMSKSLGREYFDQFGDPFKKSAIEKGIPEDVAEKVWDDLCAYGSWAFNRSHAVAYGLVSYHCCYLKAHYPLEYAAATLTHTDSVDTQIKILRELHAEGIGYIPADRDLSTNKWAVGTKDGKKVLVGPASNVVGIGPKLVAEIIQARETGAELPARAEKLLTDPVTKVDSLWPIGDRIRELMPVPAERNIFTDPTPIIECECDPSQERQVLVFCTLSSIKPKDENEEINVAKRGYKFKGPTDAVNLRLEDDTGSIFAKINRWDYAAIGKAVIERGRPGKCLYAIKGSIPKDFHMIKVKMIRYIGDMELDQDQNAA